VTAIALHGVLSGRLVRVGGFIVIYKSKIVFSKCILLQQCFRNWIFLLAINVIKWFLREANKIRVSDTALFGRAGERANITM
jgi:hypothetical protein